jgi:HK97 family phage major capsid protein
MTPEEQLKKVTEEFGSAIATLRKTHDEQLQAEVKGLGVGELKTTVTKVNDRLDKLEDLHNQFAKSMTEMRRTKELTEEMLDAKGRPVRIQAGYAEAKAAFNNFLRLGDIEGKGHLSNSPKVAFDFRDKDGKKAMSVISDADGGFTVHADMNGRIRAKVFETSPILAMCDVQTIGTDALEGIIDDNEAGAGFVGEQETRPETTTAQLGAWRIPVQELYSMPKVTQKMLDDSAWDIETYLVNKSSEKISRLINQTAVTGLDPKQLRGFLTYPAGTDFRTQVEQINMGHATLLTADGLIAIQDGLKDSYRANAEWAFNRQTRRDVRTLKDSYGRYLMEPGLANGTPGTVLGDPYAIFQDMPVVAANALAVAYADWKQFYQAVDRQGMRILRDPYTQKGFVLIYMNRRFGGDVGNHEAGKIGKVAV